LFWVATFPLISVVRGQITNNRSVPVPAPPGIRQRNIRMSRNDTISHDGFGARQQPRRGGGPHPEHTVSRSPGECLQSAAVRRQVACLVRRALGFPFFFAPGSLQKTWRRFSNRRERIGAGAPPSWGASNNPFRPRLDLSARGFLWQPNRRFTRSRFLGLLAGCMARGSRAASEPVFLGRGGNSGGGGKRADQSGAGPEPLE